MLSFKKGDKVWDKNLGLGVVERITIQPSHYPVSVRFRGGYLVKFTREGRFHTDRDILDYDIKPATSSTIVDFLLGEQGHV